MSTEDLYAVQERVYTLCVYAVMHMDGKSLQIKAELSILRMMSSPMGASLVSALRSW